MVSRCYRCGTTIDIKCCGMCKKYMCPKDWNNWIQRGFDAAYERIFGFSKDWYPEGICSE